MTEESSALSNPYSISYPEILALASEDGRTVELIERFDCVGGAMWVKNHYAKSPLVKSSRIVSNTQRFLLETGIPHNWRNSWS